MGKFNSKQTEEVRLLAIRPDGSKLLAQWQYEMRPTEGWVFNTWVEGGPEDVSEIEQAAEQDLARR